MVNNLTIGKIIIGGVSASIILWLLMQYNMSLAWMYLVVILLGVIMVYRNIFFAQLNGIIAFLKG